MPATNLRILTLTIIITSAIDVQASMVEAIDVDSAATIDTVAIIPATSVDSDAVDTCGNIDSATIAIQDSIRFSQMPWYKQLYETGFHIHDPRIDYPAFARFLLKVYDWGDHTFNSYDPEYVVSTGKNWKAQLLSYNWMESYMMMFSIHSSDALHIHSELYSDLGVHLSFMAVSLGYTAKIDNWFDRGGGRNNRTNFNFNFTCSRLAANIDVISTKGDTRITHFGDYNDGRHFSYDFNDIKHSTVRGQLYYIFNFKKYSQAAAYCYSKYQLKSAGSGILGFAFNSQKISMDFSSLPQDMKNFLPSLDDYYNFHYADYAILGGYGYNWVLHPRRWLVNLTLIPSIGFRHSYAGSSEGSKNMVAANVRARFALVYNHRAIYASLTGRFDANLFFNANYTFFNSTESLSLNVGVRF